MIDLRQGWVLDLFERLATGIVAVVGPHCEVIVHDFSDLEHSVIVAAGDVTGRKEGAPVPDLAFVSEGSDPNAPDQLNYRTRLGTHDLQSSTIWLRDTTGRLIGAVCINIDYSGLVQASDLLNSLISCARAEADLVVTDTFAKDVGDLIRLSVNAFLRREGYSDIDTLPYEAKIRLIQVLEDRSLFQMRGAVNEVANQLGVTRATVYNYRLRLAG